MSLRLRQSTMLRCVVMIAGSLVALAAQEHLTFRAGTDVVPVYVAVSGRDNRPVPGLRASDFQLKDDGKLTEITQFSNERHPIAMAIVMDGSLTMAITQGAAQSLNAAEALMASTERGD